MKSVEAVAVDGKTLRGIHGEQLPGVHLVAAYAHQIGTVVGQPVGDKRIKSWGRCPLLDDTALVTGDGRSKYFFVVNQPTLRTCGSWLPLALERVVYGSPMTVLAFMAVCRIEFTREPVTAVTSLSSQEAGTAAEPVATQPRPLGEGFEDRSQIRTGAAPQVAAALRNMTISLLRLANKPNIVVKAQRRSSTSFRKTRVTPAGVDMRFGRG